MDRPNYDTWLALVYISEKSRRSAELMHDVHAVSFYSLTIKLLNDDGLSDHSTSMVLTSGGFLF